MKNLSTILIALIVLSGLGLGVTFFVLKSKKEETPSPSVPKDTSTETTLHKPLTNVNTTQLPAPLQSDISVTYVDTLNRKFDYSMNYSGINHVGEFSEAGGIIPFVKKSFGTFRIRQRAPKMTTKKVFNPKARGNEPKEIEIRVQTPSDWVDLEIRDNQNRALNTLAVNLATGEQIKSNVALN